VAPGQDSHESVKRELRPAETRRAAEALPAKRMTMWPVWPKLNSPKNDSPDLLEPIEEPSAHVEGEVARANEGAPEREPTNSE
jgi:hypothetical protein